MKKLLLLAAMLAMVLAVAVPAAAQMANTGSSQNTQGFLGIGSTTGGDAETEGSGSGGVSSEDACHDQTVDRLATERGITTEEAEKLLKTVRQSTSDEQFKALIKEACDQ